MRAATEEYVIDANVMLRYLVRDVEDQYQRAAAVMEAVQDGRALVLCEPVTLAEVVWVLSKVYGFAPRQVSEGLLPIAEAESFHIPNKPRYVRALELFGDSVPHFGDACICAAAIETCEGRLLSFDKALSGVAGIERLEAIPTS